MSFTDSPRDLLIICISWFSRVPLLIILLGSSSSTSTKHLLLGKKDMSLCLYRSELTCVTVLGIEFYLSQTPAPPKTSKVEVFKFPAFNHFSC